MNFQVGDRVQVTGSDGEPEDREWITGRLGVVVKVWNAEDIEVRLDGQPDNEAYSLSANHLTSARN